MKDLLLGIALLLTAICCILMGTFFPRMEFLMLGGLVLPMPALAFCLKGYLEQPSRNE